jgi:hypothetical protein
MRTLLLLLWALPAFADVTAPESGGPRTVVARLVSEKQGFIACGVIAFIGVYVYEIESVKKGPPLRGRIVVDVLCPDFYYAPHKLEFNQGERHLIELKPPKREYAGTTAPPSPQASLPRFHGTKLSPAP